MLATETEAAILKRVLRPDQGTFSGQVAKEILRIGFDESDHARMAELSSKAQDGALSQAERDELDGYINVSHFIAFLHSKARVSLRNDPHSSAA